MRLIDSIEAISKEHRIPIIHASQEKGNELKSFVCSRYINPKCRYSFLWEAFSDFSVKQDQNGWRYIGDFVGAQCCWMFFENNEDNNVIGFQNGADLDLLLREMYGFEFYITNSKATYLLCFDHHDCLRGCGTAKDWIDTL